MRLDFVTGTKWRFLQKRPRGAACCCWLPAAALGHCGAAALPPWLMAPTLLLLLLLCSSALGLAASPPRAIVLMLGDDYGYGNVGFPHGPSAGNPESRTPHMDALAMGGIILDRHYVFKYCSPTRSSLMSGRLPPHVNQNNLCNNIESTSGVDLRFTLLPQKMKAANFSTHFIGKSHLGARSPANLPINRGFDTHFGFLKVCSEASPGVSP
jgi:arylsulfatase B